MTTTTIIHIMQVFNKKKLKVNLIILYTYKYNNNNNKKLLFKKFKKHSTKKY